MNLQTHHFLIDDYEIREDNQLVISLTKSNLVVPITIPLDKFYLFLLTNSKLDWELNHADHSGEHIQASGRMTHDEYWNSEPDYIKQDLYEYITTNPITFRGVLYENSVQNINLQFNLAIAKRRRPMIFVYCLSMMLFICSVSFSQTPKALHSGWYNYKQLVKRGYVVEKFKGRVFITPKVYQNLITNKKVK